MRIISRITNSFGRFTKSAEQHKFEETIKSLEPALQKDDQDAIDYVIRTIGKSLKQDPKLANQKALDLLKPMVKDGNYGPVKVIGMFVEQNPALATKETLDLFGPVLKNDIASVVRCAATETIGIILKQNKDLATKETVDKFKLIIENASSKDGSHGAMEVIDIIVKQNPDLANKEDFDQLNNMPTSASVAEQQEEVQEVGVGSKVFDGEH
jgi:hypothetical protein